jgi:hypothetical protein
MATARPSADTNPVSTVGDDGGDTTNGGVHPPNTDPLFAVSTVGDDGGDTTNGGVHPPNTDPLALANER